MSFSDLRLAISGAADALDTFTESAKVAAKQATELAAARRALGATGWADEQYAALVDAAGMYGGDAVVPDAATLEAARRAGRGGGADTTHSGGYITVAYADQLVTAYASCLAVLATPNANPWAVAEAGRSTVKLAMFWQLLGFLRKFGDIEPLAKARLRAAEKKALPPKNAGTSAAPSSTATASIKSINAGISTGQLL